MRKLNAAAFALCSALIAVGSYAFGQDPIRLPTGRFLTPMGHQTDVGSFPANLLLSPDGRFVVVTNTGFRQYLSVLRAEDGSLVSQVGINADRKDGNGKEALYYGLAFGPATATGTPLYVSRGAEDRVAIYNLASDGTLTDTGRSLTNPSAVPENRSPHHIAGIALNSDGSRLYAANNNTSAYTKQAGSLSILETATGRVMAKVTVPGFPYGVAAITRGPAADRKVYVASERDGVVAVVDPVKARVVRRITTGDHPLTLQLDRSQQRLFVANAGSDTVSVIDTSRDRVVRTIPLRPSDVRGLPGTTPTGLALSPDESRLYVALADLNAVAVVDAKEARLEGYVPVGWYPTAVAVSTDGARLFVANAKGVQPRNPNGKPVGDRGQYIQNIIEGTVATISVPDADDLKKMTAQVIANNRITPTLDRDARAVLPKSGIEHVIYVIKENRTYDQVLGDMPQGDGDPSLCLFPREVTPNQHALAERFVLLDNFYVCAEVSADGWDWSTSGMISEYTARNAPYNYSGRGRSYDFEGQTNGTPVDLLGIPDVARAPSGYIWDLCARNGVSFRNYGFYLSFAGPADRGPDGKPVAITNTPNKRVLVGKTDEDYLQFDMTYADSDAWLHHNAPCPKQTKEFGAHKSPSRFSEWKREFDAYVRDGNLPHFMMVRFPRDHTSGTSPGLHSPRAMVADNDYAVGQLVEAVSHSPYWRKTAIFVLEDDAQNGQDHVDAHRSPAYVITPWIKKSTVDHRFYNTDSILRTMELLLGMPPMGQYDAIAPPIGAFGMTPDNDAPYTAILPRRRIIAEVNTATAYRALESEKLDFRTADAVPDDLLTDIVWHAVRGADTPAPPIRRGLRVRATAAGEPEDRDERER